MRLSRLVMIIALAGGAWATWQAMRAPAPAAGAKAGAPAVPVRLAKVDMRDFAQRLVLAGRTEADATVTLKARVDGQVLAVPMREGAAVKAGDILVQLDPADLQSKLAQAQANLAKSRVQRERAVVELARYQALRDKGFISDEKVAEVRANAAAAEAGERADAAAVEAARLQAAHTTIRAPFAGMVGAQVVFPGTSVKANETALLTINRVQPLRVAFSVPERHVGTLLTRLKSPQALVADVGEGDALRPARVDFIDNAIDAGSGTALLKATLPNADGIYAAGQFVNVSLPLAALPGAAVIPAVALVQGNAGFFVFVAADGKAARRLVEVGVVQDGAAAIVKGLAAGERVVVEGQQRLTDGSSIRDADAPAAPAAAPGATRPPS